MTVNRAWLSQKPDISFSWALMVASPLAKEEISSTFSNSKSILKSSNVFKLKALRAGVCYPIRPNIFSQCFYSRALLPRARIKLLLTPNSLTSCLNYSNTRSLVSLPSCYFRSKLSRSNSLTWLTISSASWSRKAFVSHKFDFSLKVFRLFQSLNLTSYFF